MSYKLYKLYLQPISINTFYLQSYETVKEKCLPVYSLSFSAVCNTQHHHPHQLVTNQETKTAFPSTFFPVQFFRWTRFSKKLTIRLINQWSKWQLLCSTYDVWQQEEHISLHQLEFIHYFRKEIGFRRKCALTSICFVIISATENLSNNFFDFIYFFFHFPMSHLNWCAQLNLRISFVVRISQPPRIPVAGCECVCAEREHYFTDSKRTTKYENNNNNNIVVKDLPMKMIAAYDVRGSGTPVIRIQFECIRVYVSSKSRG